MGDQVTYPALYKKFRAHYKPKQFSELVDALTHSGAVRIVQTGQRKYLEVT